VPKRVVKRRVRRRPAAPAPSRPRRRLAPLTALLALAAAGAVVAAVLVVGSGGGSAVQVSERTATVTRGVIQTIVSGSGNLEPLAQQDVDFATSGKVTKIYVHAGERIGKGDLIARVDSSTQQVAVDKAEADLADAEDALTKAQEAATATAAATATPTAVAVAAQATPTGTPARPTPTATATPVRTPQATATAAPSQSGGGSTQSVASAEAAVESDQLALKQAQDDLAATELRAPMSGTVAALNGAVGDDASSAAADSSSSSSDTGFVVLADLRKLKMQVSLSESDIAKVHKGQSATVTINAASGEKVAAHVTSVGVLASDSSSSSSSSGAVSYPVEVTLDQTTQGVRAGMSATADIVVAHASGLVVPSQALRGSSVTLVRNGKRSTQPVQTGVVGDSDTQVVSGLRAGDQVLVTSTTATLGAASRASGNSGAAGGFRGFGGAGGGFTPPGAGGFRFRAGG
jgi:multidrug efflux pump subunit AcrA (membrane-fusion protein)